MSVLIKYWIIFLFDFYCVYHANFDKSFAKNNMTIQLCARLIEIIVVITSIQKIALREFSFRYSSALFTIKKIYVLWTINKWKPNFWEPSFQWMCTACGCGCDYAHSQIDNIRYLEICFIFYKRKIKWEDYVTNTYLKPL